MVCRSSRARSKIHCKIQVVYTLAGTLMIGVFPDGRLKQWFAERVMLSMFRILARCFSNIVTYHDLHNKPHSDGICVANHTSPIDCVVLSQDGCYSYVSRGGAFFCRASQLGIFLTAFLYSTLSPWSFAN